MLQLVYLSWLRLKRKANYRKYTLFPPISKLCSNLTIFHLKLLMKIKELVLTCLLSLLSLIASFFESFWHRD